MLHPVAEVDRPPAGRGGLPLATQSEFRSAGVGDFPSARAAATADGNSALGRTRAGGWTGRPERLRRRERRPALPHFPRVRRCELRRSGW